MSVLEFPSPVLYRPRQREDDLESQWNSQPDPKGPPTRAMSFNTLPHATPRPNPSMPTQARRRLVKRRNPDLPDAEGAKGTTTGANVQASNEGTIEEEDDKIFYTDSRVTAHLERVKRMGEYLEPLTKTGSSTVLLCWGTETNAYVIPVYIDHATEPSVQWELVRRAWLAEKSVWRRWLPWYGIASVEITQVWPTVDI